MNARLFFGLLLLAAALLLAACSSDTPVGVAPGQDADLVSGDLRPAGPGFSLEVKTAGTPDRPRPGPFVLHGDDLRWDAELGALVVDLSIENASRTAYPEPVGLTFVALYPDSVRVLDADNGVEGPGAAIVFGFANDDALWTPGEISLPRAVSFAAAEGEPVAFAARLDVGSGPLSGAIAGRVWNDLNRDGVMDEGEPGLAGVTVVLPAPGGSDGLATKHDGDDDDEDDDEDDCDDPDDDADLLRRAQTDADGRYAFTGLGAGLHTVAVVPAPSAEPTTPAVLHVLLAMLPDGGVSSYEHADFGLFMEVPPPGPGIELMPEADTTVRADLDARMNDNYGCDPYVAVGRGRAGEPDRIRGLVRFALPQFFREVHLVRATLVGPVARFRDGVGQVYKLGVHAVVPSDSLTPWVEGNGSEHVDFGVGCDWVDPAFGVAWVGAGDGGDDNNQTQPGFTAAPVDVATVVQDAMGPVSMAQWDVTALVQAWYNGRLPNDGLFIRDIDEPGDFRSLWFASREGEEAGLGRALRLVLEFEDTPPVR